jgi:hypothetical protein
MTTSFRPATKFRIPVNSLTSAMWPCSTARRPSRYRTPCTAPPGGRPQGHDRADEQMTVRAAGKAPQLVLPWIRAKRNTTSWFVRHGYPAITLRYQATGSLLRLQRGSARARAGRTVLRHWDCTPPQKQPVSTSCGWIRTARPRLRPKRVGLSLWRKPLKSGLERKDTPDQFLPP